jgi:hypothetical protein
VAKATAHNKKPISIMALASLTKKLAALTKKFAVFIKLNCRNLIRKIALEITRLEGKIEQAIAATKTEQAGPTKEKYKWEEKAGYAICFNLENGNKYTVSWDACSCPDWQMRRRHTGKNCKHQAMYADLCANIQKKEVLIDENDCPTGTWLRRTDDWMSLEYEVWCYTEKYNHRTGFEINQKFLGRIVQGKNEIFSATLQSMKGGFTSSENAINYLIRYNGLDSKKIAETYYKQHPQQAYSEPEPEADQPTKKKLTT